MSNPMPDPVPLVLLAAVADNGVIGSDNKLIWHLSSDLKRFKALTLGCPLLMGRKTFDSIGRPLPGRETVVLTRDAGFSAAGVHIAHDLEAALALSAELAASMHAAHVAVVGGGEIYSLTLPLAQRLYLTHVHASPDGDAWFPAFDAHAFEIVKREDHPAGGRDEYAFSFVDYQRKIRN
jgi:dihydrofolate reductase